MGKLKHSPMDIFNVTHEKMVDRILDTHPTEYTRQAFYMYNAYR